MSALPKFEFPRHDLIYEYASWEEEDEEGNITPCEGWVFIHPLTLEEINTKIDGYSLSNIKSVDSVKKWQDE